jgi:catechol 2,3-dioxygenase-like lactoylglutathione lyase family enzyme
MVHFFDIGTRPVLLGLERFPKMTTRWMQMSFLPRCARGGILAGLPCLLLAALATCFSPTGMAQDPASVPAASAVQTPNLAGIAHAAIRVADLDKSRDFYGKLGYEEAFNMSQGGKTTQSFVKINDRQFLELYPQRQPSDTIGFMHVCFESTDIQSLHDTYVARGLTPIAVRKAAAGNLLFTMAGPEKQNIEYTQYMPGSKHSNDKGLHLGANRVAEQIVAAGVEMQDPGTATAYYKEKLAFIPGASLGAGQTWLGLPGLPSQEIEIVQHAPGSVFQLFFGVGDLRVAAAKLKALGIPVEKSKSMLSIHDPDGNQLIFVKFKPA